MKTKPPKIGWLYTNGLLVVHVFYVNHRSGRVEFCLIPGISSLVLSTAEFNKKYPLRVLRFEFEEDR